MTTVPVHRPKGLLPYSLSFVKNAARFTAVEGLELGDFYRVRLPGFRIYVITDPALVREVMVRHESRYEKSKIYWKQLLQVIGPALGSLEGDEWKFLRQLHSPHFSNTAVKNYLPVGAEILHRNLDKMTDRVREEDLVALLASFNTEILLKQVFGTNSGSETEDIARFIADGQKTITWRSKYPWRPFMANITGANQRIRQHLDFFSDFAKKAVRQRKLQYRSSKTLLDSLLDHHQAHQHLKPQDLERIRNEFIVYLGAGTETMAVSEAYALHLLERHPEVLQRVEEEISEVCGGNKVSEDHLPGLSFTKAVVLESMRLQPSSYALLRDCIKEHELNGQLIKPGDSIFISIYATHRNPRLWKDPLEFKPERFLESPEGGQNNYAYMPYGAGKHQCIGRYLATPQMVLCIAAFLQRFSLEFLKKGELETESLSTLKPKGGMPVRLVPKQDQPI